MQKPAFDFPTYTTEKATSNELLLSPIDQAFFKRLLFFSDDNQLSRYNHFLVKLDVDEVFAS